VGENQMRILILIILLAAYSVSFANEPPKRLEYTPPSKNKSRESQYMDVNKPIVISEHTSTFNIKLETNPSTGYTWFYDVDQSNSHFITPVKQMYVPPADKNLVGAAGENIWTFKVNKEAFKVPTVFKFTLVYARAWEMDKPGKTLKLTIVTTQD
jgi:predicted secreted protein